MSEVIKCLCVFCEDQLIARSNIVERHLTSAHKISKIPANTIETILRNVSTPSYPKSTASQTSPPRKEPDATRLAASNTLEARNQSAEQLAEWVACHVCGCKMTKPKLSKHIRKMHNGRNDENARKLYELERRHVGCQYCGKKILVPMYREHCLSHKKSVPDKQQWFIDEYENQVQILKKLTPSQKPVSKVEKSVEISSPKKSNEYWRENGQLPEKAASGEDVFDKVRVLSGGAWGMGKK